MLNDEIEKADRIAKAVNMVIETLVTENKQLKAWLIGQKNEIIVLNDTIVLLKRRLNDLSDHNLSLEKDYWNK